MIILIVPIGAPGSGKTTLNKFLKENITNYYSTERDEEFAKLRKTNSLKKTRKQLYDNFQNFLETVQATNHKNPEINHFVYLDSSNTKQLLRNQFYQKLNPDKILELNYNLPKAILQERVKTRYHPTFPKDFAKQEQMIDIIYNNIEFSNSIDHRITKIYIEKPIKLYELYQIIINSIN